MSQSPWTNLFLVCNQWYEKNIEKSTKHVRTSAVNKVEHQRVASALYCVSTCSKTWDFHSKKIFFSSCDVCSVSSSQRKFCFGLEEKITWFMNSYLHRNLHRVVIGTNTVHFQCALLPVASRWSPRCPPFIAQMFDIPWSPLHSQVYFQLPEPIAFFKACLRIVGRISILSLFPNIQILVFFFPKKCGIIPRGWG